MQPLQQRTKSATRGDKEKRARSPLNVRFAPLLAQQTRKIERPLRVETEYGRINREWWLPPPSETLTVRPRNGLDGQQSSFGMAAKYLEIDVSKPAQYEAVGPRPWAQEREINLRQSESFP